MGVAPPVSPAVSAAAVDRVAALRRARAGARRRTALALAALLLAGGLVALCLGPQWSAPAEAWRALTGGEDGPLGFAVRQLRAPRALLAALAGASFGLGGAAFQTLLRNPLASPDIIGISSGAGAAAVFAIVILGWSGTAVSVFAVAAGLGVAALILQLSVRPGAGGGGGGGAGARLILTGIGVSAMLHSVTIYVLARAPSWTLQEALRWMTGSVNGATLAQAAPTAAARARVGGARGAPARRRAARGRGGPAPAARGGGGAAPPAPG
ncbi:MAG: iron chelate uptake ABC transporter family permease subunit, partial [Pseudomonadota bacterium]|nr:iron chelate uptake ABC transporter family permease subunit [Pseudomonadota bacterium]